MKLLLIAAGFIALALGAVVALLWTWLSSFRATALRGLFSTDPEYINVRSADNVRLLSDDQLRELERTLREPDAG